MDFLENEEDQRPVQDEVAQVVPARSFPFLRLPREIRDFIYYFALIRPGTGPTIEPARICYMHQHASSRHVSTSYWGTEKSTRLFRVNHQIYSEASEIFFSTFPSHFPSTIDIGLVNRSLRDTLNVRAKKLIRRIGFTILIRSLQGPFTAQDDDNRQLNLLPNISHIEASVALIGHDVPKWQISKVVNRILRILGPLKDASELTFRGGFNVNKQRSRILEEVREALGCQ